LKINIIDLEKNYLNLKKVNIIILKAKTRLNNNNNQREIKY
jgi:hypothetical protein